MRKRVLLVGSAAGCEFAAESNWLASRSELTAVGVDDLAVTSRQPRAGNWDHVPAPDIIVLPQSRPGCWSGEEVEQLHGRWPLARLVVLLGSWCEGELRTGTPIPGVQRIPWCDFRRRLTELLSEESAAPVSWSLPRVALDAERLELDLQGGARGAGMVVVAARSRAAFEPLADGCAALGWAAGWFRPGAQWSFENCQAGIWDVSAATEEEWQEIALFVRHLAGAAAILVMGFPRPMDRDRAAAIGYTLLAKPFQLPDLWRELAPASLRLATMGTRTEMCQSPRCGV